MNEILAFAGGDSRMQWARRYIEQVGYETADFPSETATHLILPLPAFDKEGNVTGGLPLSDLLSQISPGTHILGGKLGEQGKLFAEKGCKVTDYFLDEKLTAENAAITAEGAVQLAMSALPVTLRGNQALVIGWGRIGQLLCKYLSGLGCEVTATARKKRDLAMIEALGYTAEETGVYRKGLSRYRVIFNTVPAPVMDAKQVAETWPDCLLVELSAGGKMENAAGRQMLPAGGLPGKTAPETAGILIGKTILRLLQED